MDSSTLFYISETLFFSLHLVIVFFLPNISVNIKSSSTLHLSHTYPQTLTNTHMHTHKPMLHLKSPKVNLFNLN